MPIGCIVAVAGPHTPYRLRDPQQFAAMNKLATPQTHSASTFPPLAWPPLMRPAHTVATPQDPVAVTQPTADQPLVPEQSASPVSPTLAPATKRRRSRSGRSKGEQCIVIQMRVLPEQRAPITERPSPDLLAALNHSYQQLASRLARVLQPLALVVGQAGSALVVIGHGREPTRRDAAFVAAWFTALGTLSKVSVQGPHPAELLDAHVRGVHAELGLPFPHFEVRAGLEIFDPELLSLAERSFLASLNDPIANPQDGLEPEARLDAVCLAGWIEGVATQLAMALAQARQLRKASRRARR